MNRHHVKGETAMFREGSLNPIISRVEAARKAGSVNLWRARNRWTGEVLYMPGLFDGEAYSFPFNEVEGRKYYDQFHWAGSLSDMAQYKRYQSAYKRVKRQLGWVNLGDAYAGFGPHLEDVNTDPFDEGLGGGYSEHLREVTVPIRDSGELIALAEVSIVLKVPRGMPDDV